MTYDFSKVAMEAARVTNNSGSTQTEFKYRLVYPSEGKLKFRILFNPKSGLVGRLITRHKINKNQVVCASTYSNRKDCPICKILEDIENMGMDVPREYKARTRGIYFAQYLSSDYEISNVKKGDIILLMVPYTIYKEVNKWISDFAGDSSIMTKVFASHEGNVQVIEKGKGATEWSFRPDPYVTLESAPNDDEFSKMLENLDSLWDVMGLHEKVTPEEVALMNTTADQLRDAFMGGSVSQPTGYVPPTPPVEDRPQVNPTPVSAPVSPSVGAPQVGANTATSVAEASKPINAPGCWGNFTSEEDAKLDPSKKASSIKCKYCPMNVGCKEVSEVVPF